MTNKAFYLPKFQTAVPFSNCEVSKDGTTLSPIGNFGKTEMDTMVSEQSTKSNIIPLAVSGPLNDGKDFTITWKHAW